MHILIELTPLDPVAGSRVTLRLSSAQDRSITDLNSVRWWPGIIRKPSLSMSLFDGDFSSSIDVGQASLELSIDALEKLNSNARRFVWAGASITIYAGTSGLAWPWTTVFAGKVKSFRAAASKLSVVASVDDEPFSVQIPSATYAGTGGLEGGADIKGKPKPWAFGAPKNVEPVLIDSVNSVFQVSAYGTGIKAVTAMYERGAPFSASFGNYADYGALVAANIPAGRWATCLASGLIRLGAPPYGLITADIEGDYNSSVWARLPGAILQRIATALSISSGVIDSTSLGAIDTYAATLPGGGNISLYLTEQETFFDLAQRLALTFNAQAGISWTGKIFMTRLAIGSPVATLDSQQKRLPRVTECVETDVSPPYTKIQMGAQKCWRVHTFDEIAFGAELIDRGTYDAATVYRDGNIVTLDDGSRWLFIATTPIAGSMPTDVNTNWSRMTDAIPVAMGTNVIANSHFRDGIKQWQIGTAGSNGLGTVALDASGALKLANPSPAAGGALIGSFTPSDGSALFNGYHLFRVTPGQRVAWRMTGTVSRSGVQINPFFRLLAQVPGSGLTGSAYGTLFSGFSNFDSANNESAGYFDVPATAGVYWLNVEFYGVCNTGTTAVTALISAAELAFIDPSQTTPPVWGEGPTGEYRSTYGADWSTNLTSIPYDDILNNDDSTSLGFNGSFESWAGTYPDGWANWTGGAPTKETSIVRYGSNGVRYTSTSADIGMQLIATWPTTPTPAATIVTGNIDFYMSARTSGLPGILVRLFTNSAITTYVDTPVQPSLTTTGAWQTVPWIARVGSGQKIYGIQIFVMGSYNTLPSGAFVGTVVFDRLNFAFFNGGLDNQQVTIAANGALSGGGGGSVTITGLGYTGALNATNGAPSGTNVGSTPATTVEAGGNKANNGLDSSGNVLPDKVGTPAVVVGALSGSNYVSIAGLVNTSTTYVTAATLTITPDSADSVFLVYLSITGYQRWTVGPLGYHVRVFNGPAALDFDLLTTPEVTNAYTTATTWMAEMHGLAAGVPVTLTLKFKKMAGTGDAVIDRGILGALELKRAA